MAPGWRMKMNKEKIKDILEWIFCIIIAVILALTIKYFIGTPTIVKKTSMYPTLKQDERLILNRIPRTLHKMPERGDIITFEEPSKDYLIKEELEQSVVARYEKEPDTLLKKFTHNVLEINKASFIKRVIALPREHVEIKDNKVFINGEPLDESSYLEEGVITDNGRGECTNFVVPEGCVFAMGDNRAGSMDCRCFGCIPLAKIEGKVLIRITPFSRFGKV